MRVALAVLLVVTAGSSAACSFFSSPSSGRNNEQYRPWQGFERATKRGDLAFEADADEGEDSSSARSDSGASEGPRGDFVTHVLPENCLVIFDDGQFAVGVMGVIAFGDLGQPALGATVEIAIVNNTDKSLCVQFDNMLFDGELRSDDMVLASSAFDSLPPHSNTEGRLMLYSTDQDRFGYGFETFSGTTRVSYVDTGEERGAQSFSLYRVGD